METSEELDSEQRHSFTTAEPPIESVPGTDSSTSVKSVVKKKERIEIDLVLGRRLFIGRCASCHTFTPDAAHGIGPNLHNIMNRAAGKQDGFDYSDALRDANWQWTPRKLNEFIKNPQSIAPGTKMIFGPTGPVKRFKERKNIIAFLSYLSKKHANEPQR